MKKIILFLFLCSSLLCKGQQVDDRTFISAHAGNALGLSYNHTYKQFLFSSQYNYFFEPVLDIGIGPDDLPHYYNHQLEALVGIYTIYDKQFYAFSAGISMVSGLRRGQYLYSVDYFLSTGRYHEAIHYLALGFPVNGKIVFNYTKKRRIHFGIDIQEDFNPQKSSFYLLASIQYHLKSKR